MNERNSRDEFEAEVRSALRRDAEQIQPDDALDRIRRRTEGAPVRTHRRRWLVTGAAGLATAAAVAGAVAVSGNLVNPTSAPGPAVTPASQTPTPTTSSTAPQPTMPTPTLASKRPEQPERPQQAEPTSKASRSPERSPSPDASTAETTPPPSPSEPPSPPPPATRKLTVPVYYLGDSTNGARLFREWHAVDTADAAPVAALDQMLRVRPADRDYFSPWARGSRALSVERSGGLITVDLSSEVLDTVVPAPTADVLVQQLVYTVQAALQSTAPVQILVEGEPVSDLAGSPVSGPVSRADDLEVQALTWITSPTEGATVGRTFRVEGVVSAFEATVSWQLLDGDRVVRDGFTTAAESMTFSPYSFRVRDVRPGEYTLRAYQQSAKDGSDTFVDDKRITVE